MWHNKVKLIFETLKLRLHGIKKFSLIIWPTIPPNSLTKTFNAFCTSRHKHLDL